MRTPRPVTLFAGVLLLACSTSFAQNVSTAGSALNMTHVRMRPVVIDSSKPAMAITSSSDAIIDFPAGAMSSRASYDADLMGNNKNSGNSNSGTSKSQGNGGGLNRSRENNRRSAQPMRGLITVPTFYGSFASGGGFQEFPYSMIGGDPSKGGTTELPTKIVTVSLNLLNADGTLNVNVPYAPYEKLTVNSPNFEESNYTAGRHIQFGDAVQRAEFFNVMDEDWHTTLEPSVVDRVTWTIPATVRVRLPDNSIVRVPAYQIFRARNGNRLVLLLDLLFNNLYFNAVVGEINGEGYTTDALNVLMLPESALFSIDNHGNIGDCCVGGFHTYFADDATPQSRWISIFAGFDLPGIFGGGTADVTALSHEISESLNDPFVDNITPVWQFPGVPGLCQGNLEVGDPVEVLANSVFPVTIGRGRNAFTYHPQTEALLQWFQQGLPSDAIGGAFSYPDTTALATAAGPCTPPTT